MFIMVDYVREMAVMKPCMANMDRLSIFSSCVMASLNFFIVMFSCFLTVDLILIRSTLKNGG